MSAGAGARASAFPFSPMRCSQLDQLSDDTKLTPSAGDEILGEPLSAMRSSRPIPEYLYILFPS